MIIIDTIFGQKSMMENLHDSGKQKSESTQKGIFGMSEQLPEDAQRFRE